MKNAVRSRRSRAAALCCLLLALAAAVWAAAAGRGPDMGADCVGFGNSFARLTSGYVEVSGPDGGYAAPLAGEGRVITPCGETAAAWAPGGELLLLGGAGYRRAELPGRLLGVFGGECGMCAAVCEGADGRFTAAAYTERGAAFTAVSDGAAIVAAALSPDGRGLALLCAGEGWFIRRWDMLAGESADEPLEGPALSLKWDENGLRAVYAEAAER